jgi:hypothetical protein
LILQTSFLSSLLSFLRRNQQAFPSNLFGLLLESAQESPLFRSQDPPDSDFGQDPHPHRCSLSRRHVVYALFYYCLIGILGIQRFFEGAISLL